MTGASDKPHITVTHIISGDLWAGAEVQVYQLCRALNASEDISVNAVVFNPGILHDKLIELGIPVTLADEANSGPLAIARTIASHCKTNKTNLVHTHGFKENVLGILGKELARVRYSVRTVHGNPEQKLVWKKPYKWVLNRLDIFLGKYRQQAIIAVSSQLETTLEYIFPKMVRKIFNFVDYDEIRNQWLPLDTSSIGKTIRIGIVGRLVPVKRVDIFIRTIALLNNSGLKCKGVVIGDGPQNQSLKDLAKDIGIYSEIEFKGFVDPALSEIRKINILLMPSDHEGLPMTLLETLALEIPIVAHNVGGIPEALNFGRSGILVEKHTESGYATAINSIVDKNSLNLEYKNFYPDLLDQFKIKESISNYIVFYFEIFNRHR